MIQKREQSTEGRREEAKESGLAKAREADRSQPRSELVKESIIYPKITDTY